MPAEVYFSVGQEPLGHLKLDVLVSQQSLVILCLTFGSVAVNVSPRVLLLGVDCIVDSGDGLLMLLVPLDLLVPDPGNLLLSLRVHDLILEDGLLVDLLCLLFLLGHKLPCPLNFDLSVVGGNRWRNVRFWNEEVEDIEAAVGEFGHGDAE